MATIRELNLDAVPADNVLQLSPYLENKQLSEGYIQQFFVPEVHRDALCGLCEWVRAVHRYVRLRDAGQRWKRLKGAVGNGNSSLLNVFLDHWS
jgi:hypothetical protein